MFQDPRSISKAFHDLVYNGQCTHLTPNFALRSDGSYWSNISLMNKYTKEFY